MPSAQRLHLLLKWLSTRLGPWEGFYLGYTQKHFLFTEIRLKWVENALSYMTVELLFSLI